MKYCASTFLATLPGDDSAMRKTAMETITMVSKSRKNRLKINFTIFHKTLDNKSLGYEAQLDL